jgi:hypothetical protein
MIKYSQQFLNEIRKCAVQLGPERTKIQLSGNFNGFWVSLKDSEKSPTDKRSFREDDGIDRDGEYYIVVVDLMGIGMEDDSF